MGVGPVQTEVQRYAEDPAFTSRYLSAYNAGQHLTPGLTTDQTAALQAAVNAAIANNAGTLFIPAGAYRIDGTVNVPSTLSIDAPYSPFTSTVTAYTNAGGAVLVGRDGTAGTAVLNITGANSGYGFSIRNLAILGSNHFNTSAGAADRSGLVMTNIQTEVNLDHVFVSGFLRHGISLRGVFDGTLIGSRILFCGTSNTYAALDYRDGTSNTNAIHAFGLHIESCPFILSIAGTARHNQFVACKFELYSVAPTASPIQIGGGALENVFMGCQFVSRNADDTQFYASDTVQPAFVLVNAATSGITFTGNMFTTAPYWTGGAGEQGARWFNHSAGDLQIYGNRFQGCYGANTGARPFVFGSNADIQGNVFTSRSKGGRRDLFSFVSDCTFHDNRITGLNDVTNITGGSLFSTSGTRNSFGENRFPDLRVWVVLSNASPAQSVRQQRPNVLTLSTSATPSVAWADETATKTFQFTNGSATNVTTLTGGYTNDVVNLRFTNSNVTLVHSSGFALKGGVNVTPAAGAELSMRFDGTNWQEISRSF